VTGAEGFQNKLTSFVDGNERRYVIRQCPAFLPHSFWFSLESEVPVPVDITFSYHQLSDELKLWLGKLPRSITPFAKAEAICDTVLVVNDLL
jgi:hypothetical protein